MVWGRGREQEQDRDRSREQQQEEEEEEEEEKEDHTHEQTHKLTPLEEEHLRPGETEGELQKEGEEEDRGRGRQQGRDRARNQQRGRETIRRFPSACWTITLGLPIWGSWAASTWRPSFGTASSPPGKSRRTTTPKLPTFSAALSTRSLTAR